MNLLEASAHGIILAGRIWENDRGRELPRIIPSGLSFEERRTEVLYVQLRSTGVRLREFMEAFGEDLVLNKNVHTFIEEGWMTVNDGILKLTSDGYRFCDAIVTRLMDTPETVATRIEITTASS